MANFVQVGIETKRSKEIPVLGAAFIFNPIGSSYFDPNRKVEVVRTDASFQYAKAKVPQKWQFSRADLQNLEEFMQSPEYQQIKALLPEQCTLEPNST